MLLLQNSLEMEDDGFTLIYTYGVKKKKKKSHKQYFPEPI